MGVGGGRLNGFFGLPRRAKVFRETDGKGLRTSVGVGGRGSGEEAGAGAEAEAEPLAPLFSPSFGSPSRSRALAAARAAPDKGFSGNYRRLRSAGAAPRRLRAITQAGGGGEGAAGEGGNGRGRAEARSPGPASVGRSAGARAAAHDEKEAGAKGRGEEGGEPVPPP